MTTKKTAANQHNSNRRKIILGSLGGAAAAGAWQTPVINSILLPAHAGTSAPPPAPVVNAFFGAAAAVPMNDSSIFDIFVSPAYAGVVSPTPVSDDFTIQAIRDGETDSFTVNVFEELTFDDPQFAFSTIQILFSGTVSESSGGTLSATENPCDYSTENITAEIISVSDTTMNISLTSRSVSAMIPAGEGTLPSPMCSDTPIVANEFFGNAAAATLQQHDPSFLDALITPVFAGAAATPVPVSDNFTLQVSRVGASDDFTVNVFEELMFDDPSFAFSTIQILYSGTVNESSGGTLTATDNPCDYSADDITVDITSVSNSAMNISLSSRNVSATLPAVEGMLPMPMCVDTPLPEAYNLLDEPHPFVRRAQLEKSSSPLDILIPTAHAGQVVEPVLSFIAVENGIDIYTVTVQDTFRGEEVSGDLNIDGTPLALTDTGGSCFGQPARTASIVSISATELVLNFDVGDGSLDFTLLVGPAMLDPINCNAIPQ